MCPDVFAHEGVMGARAELAGRGRVSREPVDVARRIGSYPHDEGDGLGWLSVFEVSVDVAKIARVQNQSFSAGACDVRLLNS